MLAILGLSASLPVGALAIFSAGVLAGRLASRNHGWMAAAGACVAAVLGVIAIGVASRGEDPWWELIAVMVGVLTVFAAAAWGAGVWVGAKMRPHTQQTSPSSRSVTRPPTATEPSSLLRSPRCRDAPEEGETR